MRHGRSRLGGVPTVSTVKRIRGREVQARRQRLFERQPLCVRCLEQGLIRVATIADHVVALINGGPDSEDNLQPLCKPCHDRKTVEDLSSKPAIGVDGWPV